MDHQTTYYTNPEYVMKNDAVVALLDLLYALGILDHILVDDHGYVHRVTGLNYYIEV